MYIYCNESEVLITSLNLLVISVGRSEEIGVIITKKDFLNKYGINKELSFKFETENGTRKVNVESILDFINFVPKQLTLKLTNYSLTKDDFIENLHSLAHFMIWFSMKTFKKSIEHIKNLKKDDEEKIRLILRKLYMEGYEFFSQLYEMTERDKNLKELNFNPNKPLTLKILSLERFDKLLRVLAEKKTIDYYFRSTKEHNRFVFSSFCANTEDINFNLSLLNWYPTNRDYTHDIIEFGMFKEIPKEQYKNYLSLSVALHHSLIERVYKDISYDDISSKFDEIEHFFISIPLYSYKIKPTDLRNILTKIELNNPLNSLAN